MKIAIAGYGIEGKASYQYWNTGEHEITIADESTEIDVPNGTKTILGEDTFSRLAEFDMVVRTASLPPRSIITNGKIWSATNEFFAKCPGQIIGVTGTKGKGTTCSMIVSILKAAGKTVHLVGNIGIPALEILPTIKPDDIVVYELSSFQLWDIEKSPQVGVCLLIEADHLNVHSDMTDYVDAKANIARFQNEHDAFFFHPTNEYAKAIALQTVAHVNARYNCADDMPSVYFDAHDFRFQGEAICTLDALQLLGDHNKENACAALSVAKYLDVENVACEEGLRNFTGLPHRLEFVREVDGVKYYDDSFSSAPPATKVAVRAFESPKLMICGGYDRGLDLKEMVDALMDATIKHRILIGQTAKAIASLLDQRDINDYEIVDGTIEEAVRAAKSVAVAGDVVILSPGCASFDMFKNFSERGKKFQEVVRQL